VIINNIINRINSQGRLMGSTVNGISRLLGSDFIGPICYTLFINV
jgi:hypothetical protein